MAEGFHKAHCGSCQRETVHYKEKGDKPAHCTDHSPWPPNRKRTVVNDAIGIQMDLSRSKSAVQAHKSATVSRVTTNPMAKRRGSYHKAECLTCNKETWHYKSALGKVSCTVHESKLVQVAGDTVNEVKGPQVHIAGKLDRSLWRHATPSQRGVSVTNEDWAQAMFPPELEKPQLDPNQVYCSFCGGVTDQINTLMEKKPVIRRIMQGVMIGDEVVMQERVTSKIETVHACPNCVLEVRRPIVVRRV